MKATASIAALAALLFLPVQIRADVDFPETCRTAPRPVALMDCIQTQIELMRLTAEYHGLVRKIEEISPSISPPPEVPVESEEPALERIAWFDENLEIYAIIGSGDDLVAHARLGGREYRLRRGDALRLARVINVHERGIELSVAGTEISIGLSGRNVTAEVQEQQ